MMSDNQDKASINAYKDVVKFVTQEINQLSRSGHYYGAYVRLIEAITYSFAMGVDGDIVEFGTWTGRSSVVIAETVSQLRKKLHSKLYNEKKIYYCDSFCGLPQVTDPVDLANYHVLTGSWKEQSMTWHSKQSFEELVANILDVSQFEIVDGFFSNTIRKAFEDKKISMVHCDVDLYSSTIDCMQPLFEMSCLSEGAIVLFDDWNCSAANPKQGQRKAFNDLCKKHSINYSDEGSYSYHGRSFLIHSYRPG